MKGMTIKMRNRVDMCKSVLCDLTQYVLERARTFTAKDYTIMKATLISLGIILGATFSKFFRKLLPLFVIVFIVSYVYTMMRLFSSDDDGVSG